MHVPLGSSRNRDRMILGRQRTIASKHSKTLFGPDVGLSKPFLTLLSLRDSKGTDHGGESMCLGMVQPKWAQPDLAGLSILSDFDRFGF